MGKVTGRVVMLGTVATLAFGSVACGGKCPSAASSGDAQSKWESELDKKKELVLNPSSEITIKRDVHNIVVSVDADKLANAFHEVMRDPKRQFGLIKVDRSQANVGHPFKLGERFQGRYQVDKAIMKDLRGAWAKKVFGDFTKDPGVEEFLCRLENQATSDYGVIAKLDLSPKPGEDYVLSYRYLEGSPIAGSSTFVVSQVSPGVSKLTQIFEYQELSLTFALFFSSGGLKLHDQVVYSQVSQTADLLHAKIISTDIPDTYWNP